jgi:hypothetical protein
MLNNEQERYIDGLRATHPGLNDSTIKQLLVGASWSSAQIESALARFHGAISVPTPPTTPSEVAPRTPAPSVSQSSVTPASSVSLETTKPQPFSGGKIVAVIAGLIFLFSALGAAGYFIYTKTDLFSAPQLTNENILNNVFAKLGEIETASYGAEISLGVNPREEGAVSFSATAPTSPEELKRYQRDEDRFRDVEKIYGALQAAYGLKFVYPATLATLSVPTTDPLGKP